MADDKIVIEIELDDGSVKKGYASITKSAEDVGKNTAKALDGPKSGLSSLAKGAGIAIAAFAGFKAIAGVMNTLKQSIGEAAKQAQSVQQLNSSLALSGGFSREASQRFQDLASSIQETTVFGDELILQQAAIARNFTRTNEEAEKLITAAVDLSAATGMTLDSAVKNLGKTFAGLTGQLGESIPALRQFTAEQLKAGAALDLVSERFGGAATLAAQTAAGAWMQLQNNLGDMREEFGKIITQSPSVIASMNTVSGAFVKIGEAIKNAIGNRDIFRDFIINFSIIAQAGVESARQIGVGFELAALRAQQAWYAFKVLSTAGLSEAFNQELQSVLNKIEQVKFEASQDSAITTFFDELILKVSETNGKLNDMTANLRNMPQAMGDVQSTALTVSEAFKATTDGMGEAIEKFASDGADNFKRVGAQMFQSIGNGAGQAFAAFGRAIATGENALQAFIDSLLASMGQMAIQLGTQFILQGAAYMWAGLPNGGALMAAGAALATFGGVLSALGGGQGAIGGVGSEPVHTNDMALSSPDDLENEKPVTQVAVNIQGDVLDSRDSGMRIIDLIKEYTDRNGRTEVLA